MEPQKTGAAAPAAAAAVTASGASPPVSRAAAVLPQAGKRNVLVTSALPYVNNVPHLGNIIGCVLSADVYARYCRQRGYNVAYICGTDEYGTATETKALEDKISPQELCDKYHRLHAQIYEWFEIGFDYFGRTTTPAHTDICQSIFRRLEANHNLVEDSIVQHYCENCNRFLADRFVEGICPACRYQDARGDQCDKCQKVLDPDDLIEPRCKVCRRPPVKRSTQHLFLDLPKLRDRLGKWVDKASADGQWSANSIQVTRGWLKEGLKPRCITRDLKWGVPVPSEKFRDKVFYVWFDAPIGYISITANYTPQWQQWWHRPDDVQLVQFMGKDNIPFHTVIFPSALLGTDDKWTLLHKISTTEYLNYESDKFSKSRKIGVFGDDAAKTGIPVEVWRYYLLVNRPEVADSVFLWDDFRNKNNAELLGKLGNFINRTLKFLDSNYAKRVPSASTLLAQDVALVKSVSTEMISWLDALENVQLKEGCRLLMHVASLGNEYLQSQKPWELIQSDKSRCDTVLNLATNLVRLLAALCEPYMPSISRKVLAQLALPYPAPLLHEPSAWIAQVPPGHCIGAPEPLFRKLEESEIDALKDRFRGSGPREQFPLDVRVGRILTATNHSSADRLYIVELDMGRGEKRTVLAGLKEYYTAEQLLNRHVAVVCNLKPATIQGVVSHGMLLVAAPAAQPMCLLSLAATTAPGTVISATGHAVKPKPNMDKKKDFDKLVLRTNDAGLVLYVSNGQEFVLRCVDVDDAPVAKGVGAAAQVR